MLNQVQTYNETLGCGKVLNMRNKYKSPLMRLGEAPTISLLLILSKMSIVRNLGKGIKKYLQRI